MESAISEFITIRNPAFISGPTLRPSPNKTLAPNLRVGLQAKPGQETKKKGKRQQTSGRMIMYRHINKDNKVERVMRRAVTISSNASGIIPVATYTSDSVTSSLDWAAFSGEFQNYRVKEMKIRFVPATTNATSVTGPYQGILALSRFWALAPTSTTNMASEPSILFASTLEEFTVDNNWLGFKDAEEWSPVGTSLLASNIFGIAFATFGGATLAASSVIFSAVVEYRTEFIGAY
jgi:hypothetical protein